VKQTYQ